MRLTLVLVLWFIAASAVAQNTSLPDSVEARREALQTIESQIATNPEIEYLTVREQLRRLRAEELSATRPLQARADELLADLERLGPIPEAGVSESAHLAETRATLAVELRALTDAIRQSELSIARASRLLEDINALRREAFYSDILQRGASPLSPSLWVSAATGVEESWQRVTTTDASPDSQPEAEHDLRVFILIGAVIVAILLFWPVRRWIDRSVILRVQGRGANSTSRSAVAAARTLARIIPGLVGGAIILETARAVGYVGDTLQPVIVSLWASLLVLFVVDGVATAVFAPKTRDWRLIPIRSRAAMTIRIVFWLAAGLFAFDSVLNAAAPIVGLSAEVTLLQSSLVAILGAGLLFLFCARRIWILQEDHADFAKSARAQWLVVRHAGQITAILITLAALLGYVSLARYAVTRIFLVTLALGLAWFARALIQEGINAMRQRAVKRAKTDELIEEHEEHLIFFWIGLVVDIALALIMMPIIFVLLGVDWPEVRDWMRDAFFGFRVGTVTISLAQIFSAFFTFAFILVVTRFIQRGADKRVFAKANIDPGVRNSFRTLIGYVGLVIAAVSAITMMGLNLANLAIIAGALSVGIGFGLQSIVNNFVSGLILLFERPIKVGDWIVIASGEGIVKQISVRSTEIETFDRASIIVPNSELIASSVQNWTHKDKFSRIIIPIGVAYKEDPKQVVAILENVMRGNRRVVRYPEPLVYFAGFGDSSLDFQMRVFIRTPDDRIIIQNELRIAAFESFREYGVEIPFPQRDLHLKTAINDLRPSLVPNPEKKEEM